MFYKSLIIYFSLCGHRSLVASWRSLW